ncbi:2-nitropropane dioxygenase [Tieghemostelium lacteum]|uniref:2-nitropropane dioxygenase n=1 Tax=Tieghemostelium lacteum TaxID=361077 RepID=A0A151Z4F3_TIELA|nr:2-nitropropane dioxygenase [Tieghemostelium lacteum]|eukprot:KYQ88836.1 2-nitropropane dioxygenase [Tieghemostelium lacteum]
MENEIKKYLIDNLDSQLKIRLESTLLKFNRIANVKLFMIQFNKILWYHKENSLKRDLVNILIDSKEESKVILGIIVDSFEGHFGEWLRNSFFSTNGNDIRIALVKCWFDQFKYDGINQYGSLALERYLFKEDSSRVWNDLVWNSAIKYPPSVVVLKRHLFLQLNIEETIKNYIRYQSDFWNSTYLLESITNNSSHFLRLDSKQFEDLLLSLLFDSNRKDLYKDFEESLYRTLSLLNNSNKWDKITSIILRFYGTPSDKELLSFFKNQVGDSNTLENTFISNIDLTNINDVLVYNTLLPNHLISLVNPILKSSETIDIQFKEKLISHLKDYKLSFQQLQQHIKEINNNNNNNYNNNNNNNNNRKDILIKFILYETFKYYINLKIKINEYSLPEIECEFKELNLTFKRIEISSNTFDLIESSSDSDNDNKSKKRKKKEKKRKKEKKLKYQNYDNNDDDTIIPNQDIKWIFQHQNTIEYCKEDLPQFLHHQLLIKLLEISKFNVIPQVK